MMQTSIAAVSLAQTKVIKKQSPALDSYLQKFSHTELYTHFLEFCLKALDFKSKSFRSPISSLIARIYM